MAVRKSAYCVLKAGNVTLAHGKGSKTVQTR